MTCGQEINQGRLDYIFGTPHPTFMEGGGKALKDMNKEEVYAIAKRIDIVGRSTMTKAELVSAIRRKAAARLRNRKN